MGVRVNMASYCLLTLVAHGAHARCNPEMHGNEYQPSHHQGLGVKAANLHFLEQHEEGPACLDGSPYGFYFSPSTTGSTKWTISINGGGWCYDEVDCYCRSKKQLGTSKNLPASEGCA